MTGSWIFCIVHAEFYHVRLIVQSLCFKGSLRHLDESSCPMFWFADKIAFADAAGAITVIELVCFIVGLWCVAIETCLEFQLLLGENIVQRIGNRIRYEGIQLFKSVHVHLADVMQGVENCLFLSFRFLCVPLSDFLFSVRRSVNAWIESSHCD